MKFFALALLLAAPDPAVRFEPDGVRVGETLVTGSALEMRDSRAGTILVSGNCVEAVASTVEIGVGADRTLVLEPGVRAQRTAEGIVLSTHLRQWVRLQGSGAPVVLRSPATARRSDAGWEAGGRAIAGAALRARLQQDDPDKELEKMKEAARKIEDALKPKPAIPPPPIVGDLPPPPVEPPKKPRARRVFGDDPILHAEITDSPQIRRVPQVSPSGF